MPNKVPISSLKQRAEEKAREQEAQSPDNIETLSLEEIRRMVHELRVDRIELEMQNEELRKVPADEVLGEMKNKIGLHDFYHVLVEKASDGIWLLDKKFRSVYVNPAMEAILGYANQEIIGRSWYDFGDPEWVARAQELEKRRESGVKEPHLFLFIHKDGRKVLTRIATSPLFDKDGNFDGALGILSNITRQKEADEALKIKDILNAVAKSSGIGMCLINPDYTIEWYNDLYATWFGKLETTKGRNCFEVFDGRDAICPECPSRVSFEKGILAVTERSGMTTSAGAGRIIALTTSPIRDTNGNVIQVVEIAQDITERKLAEAEKDALEAQNLKLQKSESLGRMAGAIAHHFNNQLQVVMMNLDFAMRGQSQGEVPTENLTGAMQSAIKAAQVSTLMLTYLGQTNAKREPLDLSEACIGSLPMLRATIPNGVVLDTDFPSLGPVIHGNVDQIQQVLVNLVTNAWEAHLDGRGGIRVAVKVVSPSDISVTNRFPIDCHPQDMAYACLEVADEGCGISPKAIETLFDPFFSTKFTGRGLGLPAVLGIVRAHQGVITVESEPGRGSVFRVFLPISSEAIPQKQIPTMQVPALQAQASKTAGNGTILVVDDEITLRNVIATAIKGMGFNVIDAWDGVHAVEVFRQHQEEIRLVVCDLTMPRMDGWQTLTVLRQLAPDIPVILSSGYSEAQMMAGNHPELPQAFLSKPYQYEQLSEAVFRVLRKKECR